LEEWKELIDPPWWSDEGCTLTLVVTVQMKFRDRYVRSRLVTTNDLYGFGYYYEHVYDRWTNARKAAFKNAFKTNIESTWNNSGWVLKSEGKLCECTCKDGYKPRVKIEFTPPGKLSSSEDWEVTAYANSFAKVRWEPETKPADETYTGAWAKFLEDYTRMSAHEFGHYLGLMHPGYKMTTKSDEYYYPGNVPDDALDYLDRPVHGAKDLMGHGNGFREFYFDKWKDKLNDELQPHCNWKARKAR
jgi:hypothetical protein